MMRIGLLNYDITIPRNIKDLPHQEETKRVVRIRVR